MNNRLIVATWLLTWVCLLTPSAFAQPPGPATQPEARAADRAAVLDRLARPIDLDVEETPLDAVIDFLAERSGVPIQVNRKGIELVGIKPDTHLTLKARGLSVSSVLDSVMDSLGADLGIDERVSYEVLDDRVVIDLRGRLNANTGVLRVYDLSPMLMPPAKVRLAAVDDARALIDRAGLFGEDLGPPEAQARRLLENALVGFDVDRVDQIHDLIQDTVGDPNGWLDEIAVVQPLGSLLIIRAPHSYHDEIGRLLETLETARRFDPPVEHLLRRAMVRMHLTKAEALRQQGEFDRAAREAEVAVRLMPDDATAAAMVRLIRDSRPKP